MQVSSQGSVFEWLRGIWPSWMFLPGIKAKWARQVTINAPNQRIDDATKIRKGQLIDISLGQAFFLRKFMRFPKAARADLKKAVDLKIRQTSPRQAAGLIWRYEIANRTDREIEVQVFLLKVDRLRHFDLTVRSKGARLRTITIEGCHQAKPLVDNSKATDQPHRYWTGVSILAVLAWLVFHGLQHIRTIEGLEHQLKVLKAQEAALSEQALILSKAESAATESRQSILADLIKFEQDYHRLPIILKLTSELPDTVWVSELTLQSASMRISVFASGNVSALIQAMNAWPDFEIVELDGPVTFDSISRSNRADIVATFSAGPGASK